jgi:site-specific DNA recombinase
MNDKIQIAIYVRESRDDDGENIDTIETQRDLLLDYASRFFKNSECQIYMDDNVSGSLFNRPALTRLKKDVLSGRIDCLLLKDLSRLGRNNAKTLLLLDFLEENGVRILTLDGKYDSRKDNDTVGIETWFNERYVRDISKKIRTTLRYKIERGEYLGNAPYGYKKSSEGKNHLIVDSNTAHIVREIFDLYKKGYGYTSIANILNERNIPSPSAGKWNHVTIGRITSNRVYTGDTVQGISEKISFKSKKTRRLPQEEWVVTENTHTAIIPKAEFEIVQKIKEKRRTNRMPHKNKIHLLRGLIYCGDCASIMYARKHQKKGVSYVCSNYFKNGAAACSSHLVYESQIIKYISTVLEEEFTDQETLKKLNDLIEKDQLLSWDSAEMQIKNLAKQISSKQKQQQIVYMDRLEGRITTEFFEKMNRQIEENITFLQEEKDRLMSKVQNNQNIDPQDLVKKIINCFKKGEIENESLNCIVNKVTIYDKGLEQGIVEIDFKF